jgi:PadR family transcriptional regulator PadR
MTLTDPTTAPPAELFDALRLELRRGCLVVAVLAQLKTEQYGYTLRKSLSDDGLVIDESTLYPLLRRLESQGLLRSEWREENKRNKRFYRLSTSGAQVLEQLLEEWRRINASIDRMVGPRRTTGARTENTETPGALNQNVQPPNSRQEVILKES